MASSVILTGIVTLATAITIGAFLQPPNLAKIVP